jgi:hypothetical protein
VRPAALTWRAATLGALAAASLLAGCAQRPQPLYHWEGYQRQVYEYLKGDGSPPGEQLTVLQAQAEKARATGAALPPGFRAHLGMLHLQMGSYDEARRMLEAEKSAFPESTQYMDFLLKRMSEQQSS